MYIAENLRLLKNKWGISNKKMGELFKVNTHQVGSYSRGETEPNVNFMIRCEEVTGIPFRQFVTTMLKPEELPASPLSEKEFLEVSAGWGKEGTHQPSTPIEEKVERLESCLMGWWRSCERRS